MGLLEILIVVILIAALFGSYPGFGWANGYSYTPFSAILSILLILVLLRVLVMGRFMVSAYEGGELVQRRWPSDNMVLSTLCQLSCVGRRVVITDITDDLTMNEVEGRSPFNRVNSARQGKIDE